MARPARPEQTKSARSSRQLSRFCYLINPDKVFGTHKDGQNETEQPDHSASLVDSITSSTRIRFSVHTAATRGHRLRAGGHFSAITSTASRRSTSLSCRRSHSKFCIVLSLCATDDDFGCRLA